MAGKEILFGVIISIVVMVVVTAAIDITTVLLSYTR